MSIRMTEEQARAAGLLKGKAKKKSTAGMGRGGAVSRCTTCQVEFTSDAAEDRHMAETPHRRFETVVEQT